MYIAYISEVMGDDTTCPSLGMFVSGSRDGSGMHTVLDETQHTNQSTPSQLLIKRQSLFQEKAEKLNITHQECGHQAQCDSCTLPW